MDVSVDAVGTVPVGETIWVSNGSANFSAVELRPCRMIMVVLWSCAGGMTTSMMVREDFGFDDDIIEEYVTVELRNTYAWFYLRG